MRICYSCYRNRLHQLVPEHLLRTLIIKDSFLFLAMQIYS